MVPDQPREFEWMYETPRDPSVGDVGQKWLMNNFSHEVSKVNEGDTSYVGVIFCDVQGRERSGQGAKWESNKSLGKLQMEFEYTDGNWVLKKVLVKIEVGPRTLRLHQPLDNEDKKQLVATLRRK